jgi:membrane protein
MKVEPPGSEGREAGWRSGVLARMQAAGQGVGSRLGALERRLPGPLRAPVQLIRRTAREFDDDDCATHAAAIAYHTFFALFPLLLGAGVIVSYFSFGQEAYEALLDALNQAIPTGEALIADAGDGSGDFRGWVGLAALVALLWSASRLFAALRRALTVAWDADRHHRLVHGKMVDLFAVLVLPGLAIVSVGASGMIDAARFVVEQAGQTIPVIGYFATESGAGVIGRFVPLGVSTLAFALTYVLLPNTPVPWREAFPGAALAAVLFEFLKIGFAWYATNLATFNVVYGSLGTVIAVMLWIYLSAIVLLIGAEFATEFYRMRHGELEVAGEE